MANESMRKILIGLITDKNFVKEYIKTFPEAQFKGMVGVSLLEKWSRAYYLKYGDAMKSNVRVALDRMIQGKRIGEDDLRYIEMLLQSLSAESDAEEATPVEYLLDLAVQEINRINLAKIAELSGFKTYSTFYREYTKKYGVSPNTAYNKNIKKWPLS